MTNKNAKTRWLRFLPPVALLAAAAAIGFWGSDPGLITNRLATLFAQEPATASEAIEANEAKCTKPCCAAKTVQAAGSEAWSVEESQSVGAQGGSADWDKTGSAPACCPNCAAKQKGQIAPDSTAGKADSCCPAAQKTGGDACCPPGETATAACGSGGSVAWTGALVQEYKDKGDWCASHGVPESMCVRCNPTLVEIFKARGDWCAGHNLPESQCTVCNKSLIALGIGRDWCDKHGVPESQCVYCNPGRAGQTLPASMLEAAEREVASLEAESAIESFKSALSGPVLTFDKEQRTGINPDCPLHHMKIRLKSVESAREAGLRIKAATSHRVTQSLRCYGEVQFDRSRYALLSPRAPGIVSSVEVDFGSKVAKGDVLAVVDSTEFGKSKADFLRAQAEVNRWKWLADSFESGGTSGAVARKEIIEAKASLEAAQVELAISRQTLRNFGLAEEEIDRVAESKDTGTLLPLLAPFDATVVELTAVKGELVGTGTTLMGIADLSRMWLHLDLYAEDLARVALGMPVTFLVDRMKGETFPGKITWVSSDIDPKTRTGEVRAELDNSGNLLRAGLFGQGIVAVHQDEEVLTVPNEAIQWDGCCNLVFVQQSEDAFEPRKVRLGYESNGFRTVLAGLLPGERIVTQGSYLMKTEILKANIGAGCCAEHGAPASAGEEKAESKEEVPSGVTISYAHEMSPEGDGTRIQPAQ